MTTLKAPNGRLYHTDDEAEVRSLTVGQGYRIVPDEPPPEPYQWVSYVDSSGDTDAEEEDHPVDEDV